ncbi:hypothetical protein ACLOJK_011471 [Asimina triloba]
MHGESHARHAEGQRKSELDPHVGPTDLGQISALQILDPCWTPQLNYSHLILVGESHPPRRTIHPCHWIPKTCGGADDEMIIAIVACFPLPINWTVQMRLLYFRGLRSAVLLHLMAHLAYLVKKSPFCLCRDSDPACGLSRCGPHLWLRSSDTFQSAAPCDEWIRASSRNMLFGNYATVGKERRPWSFFMAKNQNTIIH